jgi:hypothetical protein
MEDTEITRSSCASNINGMGGNVQIYGHPLCDRRLPLPFFN